MKPSASLAIAGASALTGALCLAAPSHGNLWSYIALGYSGFVLVFVSVTFLVVTMALALERT